MKQQVFRARWLLLLLTCLALIAVFTLPNLVIHNQLTAFFSKPHQTEQQRLMQVLNQQLITRPVQQPIMVSIELSDSLKLSQLSQFLATELGSKNWVVIVKNSTPILGSSADNLLNSYRYLLSDFKIEDFPQHLKTLWEAWQLGLVLDKKTALQDPSFQWLSYLNQNSLQTEIPEQFGVWMVKDGANFKALLLIELMEDETALIQLQTQVSQFSQANQLVPETIKMSSAALIALNAKTAIQTQMTWLSIAATLAILGFLGVMFRNAFWVALSFLPLAGGSLIAVVAVQWVFGSVEALTLALGIVLLGVTVDYPIHAFSALRFHPKHFLATWRIIRLGGFTTLLGFSALGVLGVMGLSQMALFASVGILISLLITRIISSVFLPQNLQQVDVKPSVLNRVNVWQGLWRLRYLLSIFVLLMVGLVFLKPIQWQNDLASMSPVPSSILQQDQQLRKDFLQSESAQFLILQADSVEGLLQQQEALQPALQDLQARGDIQGYLMLSQWLPSQALQQQRKENLPSEELLKQVIAESDSALTPKVFKSFMDAVEVSRNLDPLDVLEFEKLALDWQKSLLPTLISQSVESSGLVTGKVLLREIGNPETVAQWAQQHKVLYFNQRALVTDLINQLRLELLGVFGLLLGVFMLTLIAVRRSFAEATWVMLPIIMGVALAWMLLSLLGQSLTIFHLIGSLLVMAIGLDYSLFVRQSSQQFKSLASLHMALGTTLISFGFLTLSDIPILQALGQTLVLGTLSVYGLARLQHYLLNLADRH